MSPRHGSNSPKSTDLESNTRSTIEDNDWNNYPSRLSTLTTLLSAFNTDPAFPVHPRAKESRSIRSKERERERGGRIFLERLNWNLSRGRVMLPSSLIHALSSPGGWKQGSELRWNVDSLSCNYEQLESPQQLLSGDPQLASWPLLFRRESPIFPKIFVSLRESQ